MSSNYSNKIFSNYFLVIISISIVLFLISSFTLIALNSEKIINDFKENIPVVVFIKDQSNKIELSKFEKNLENLITEIFNSKVPFKPNYLG